jgi:hypothetical protein
MNAVYHIHTLVGTSMKKKNYLEIVLLGILLLANSCKKESKQEIVPGDYRISILSTEPAIDTLGQLCSVPLEIKLYKGNDEVTPNSYDHIITVNNFICNTAGTDKTFYADYGNDRIIRLRWYTGNIAGNQRVIISLKDNQGNLLAQAEIARTVIESSSQWKATCKNDEATLFSIDGKFWAVGSENTMTSNDGVTWEPGHFPEMGLISEESPSPLFNAEQNGVLFTATKPDWSDRTLVFRSPDRGNTWNKIFELAGHRILAVGSQEELIISGSQLYVMYKSDNGYLSGKTLINSNGFTSFLMHKNRFYTLDLTDLYSAETLTGNYTRLNEGFDLQYIWADKQDLFLFGKNKIYKMGSDGITPSLISTLPVNEECTVLKVVRAKDNYYIAYKKNTSVSNGNYSYLVSTKDWNTFSPEILIHNSPYFSPNIVASENGQCLIQQAEGFYHIQ